MFSLFTETKTHKVSNLLDLLRLRAAHQPDKIAYIFLKDGESEESSLTYGELDRQARLTAVRLQSLGQAGERALLLYPPGPEYIAAFFGCLYAGFIAVPAYPPHPARPERTLPRLRSIANSAKPCAALMPMSLRETAASVFSKDADFSQMRRIISGGDTENIPISDCTSGSTGNPKGVMVSHGNLLHNEQMIQTAFGHTENSVGVGWLPLYHDMGLIGNVLQPLYSGMRCVLMSPTVFLQKPFRWLRAVSRYRGTSSGGPKCFVP